MSGPVWDGQGKDPWLPARLNARLDAAKHEREIRAGYWSMLSGWMTSTSRRVLRSQRPDADVIHAQAPAWRTAVEHLVHGEIFLAFASAYRRLLGEDYPVDQRAFTNRYLIEVTNRLVRIPEETYDLVAGQMSAGINDGDSIPQLAARVNGVFSLTESERWPNRAVVVARTEAIGALNAGRDDAFKAAAEQEPDTEFERLWLCVLPDTPVVANGVRAIARRWYDGEIREVRTASGRRVSLTPQHPVLTDRGWVAAENLQLGDHLVSVRGIDAVGTPDVEARHASIEECFNTAAQSREVRTLSREVPGSVDLDGNPAYEKVDVVSAYGHLAQGVEPCLAEDLARFSLEFSDKALADLVVEGALPHGIFCDHHARFSDALGGFKVALSCAVPLSPDDPSGALVAHRDPCDPENSANRVAAGAELSAQAMDRTSGLVELDNLIGIEVRTWSGHVFDFTTYCHWFLADGIVVHNSTEDNRTRPTHQAADLQRVPLGTPFQVGGFELRFPGDPMGPPQEVIQCRCTSLLVEVGESIDLSNRQFKR